MRRYITDEIKNQIEFRYNIVKPISIDSYTNGMIITDQYIPYLLYKEQEVLEQFDKEKNFEIDKFRTQTYKHKNGFAISELALQMGAYKKLSIDKIVRLLGYSKTEIKTILNNVRKKKYEIVFIGMGGAVSNIIHWTKELQDWTNRPFVFNNVTIFENDSFDLTNLPRIPFIPTINYISGDNKFTKAEMLPEKYASISSNGIRTYIDYFNENIAQDLTHPGKYINRIIIGAPDIETRNLLAENKINFLSTTHKGVHYNLTLNPEQTNDLVIEGYGKIDLFHFYMNMVDMTIRLLDFLSRNNFARMTKTMEENYRNQENIVLNYSTVFQQIKSRQSKTFYDVREVTINGYKVNFAYNNDLNSI